MPIINNNNNNNSMPTNGSTGSNPLPPSTITSNNGLLQGNGASSINSPTQIIGLVPLFPCCNVNGQNQDTVPAHGGFSATLYGLGAGNYSFALVIGGITYSIINIPAPTTSVTIANIVTLINAALVSIGITSSVIVTSGSLATNTATIVVTLYGPIGSGSAFNGVTVSATTANIKIYNTHNFSGGIGIAQNNPCLCECREGLYGGDSIPDDRKYTLPVFADLAGCNDSYHNDINSWLLTFPGNLNPITNGFFKLKKLVGSTYTTIATLNNNTYGTPISNACGQVCNLTISSGTLIIGNTYVITSYIAGDDFTNVGASSNANGITFVATGNVPTTWINGTVLTNLSPCTNVNYGGFILSWQAVLLAFGPGIYLFTVTGGTTTQTPQYCLTSPPFCLNPWTCEAVDGTVKFEADYQGGNFGSVTTQGQSWSLCCAMQSSPGHAIVKTPLAWQDSIRMYGFFGYETAEYQRDFIKYATGVINKIRDEAVKTFTVRTDRWPMWMHQRFYAYGLMADQLYVSDYNINNANYNYKHFWIVADSNYAPQYTNYSRYTKILDLKFKEGDQFVFRDRCC